MRTFCPHLGSFCVVSFSLRFGQISPLAFFRWFLPRPRIGMMSLVTVSPVSTAFHSCCLSITGYKTQHSYPRSRLITWRRPKVKFGRNVVKKKQRKNDQDEDKKSAINKKIILRLRSLTSKWFQLKTTEKVCIYETLDTYLPMYV